MGLDGGPRYFRSLPQQREIFSHVLELCASRAGKILTVHSVRAVKDVLDMMEKHFAGGQSQVVLHWFTGTRAQARRAVELGCYFSTNARMFDKLVHRALVQSLPLERLLTESDGPFVKNGVRPVEPGDVIQTVTELAALRSLAEAEMARQLLQNLSFPGQLAAGLFRNPRRTGNGVVMNQNKRRSRAFVDRIPPDPGKRRQSQLTGSE